MHDRLLDAVPTVGTGIHPGRLHMNIQKLVGVLLIVAGALALFYGSFSFTRDSTAVKLGPIELAVKEKETINVPVWAGVGAIVVGTLILLLGGKRR